MMAPGTARAGRLLVAIVVMRLVRILADLITPPWSWREVSKLNDHAVAGPFRDQRLAASVGLLEFGRRIFLWAAMED